MPSGTRSESLKHLLTVVLGKTEDGAAYQLVVGHFKCQSPSDLTKLKEEEFYEAFPFVPNPGDSAIETTLARGEAMELLDMQEFIRSFKNGPIKDWKSTMEDEFLKFRDDMVDDTILVKAQAVTAAAAAAVAAAANPQPTPTTGGATSLLTAYKMKRLYTDYKAINKRQFFTQWLKEVKVTAHTHDSVNPLNPTYVPATADEKAVFEADNTFMFNVAAKTVKYSSGKTIIQKHLDDMDGQTTFAELTADAKGEVVAKINEMKLEDSLRKLDASPDKWNNTGESFLDHFETKLVQLNDSRDKPVEDKEVREWLTYCLRGHPAAVASINQQRQLEIYQKETNPTYMRSYSHFMNGLRVSLQQYDEEHKPKTSDAAWHINKATLKTMTNHLIMTTTNTAMTIMMGMKLTTRPHLTNQKLNLTMTRNMMTSTSSELNLKPLTCGSSPLFGDLCLMKSALLITTRLTRNVKPSKPTIPQPLYLLWPQATTLLQSLPTFLLHAQQS
jgi:hypothetical protein